LRKGEKERWRGGEKEKKVITYAKASVNERKRRKGEREKWSRGESKCDLCMKQKTKVLY